MTDRLDQLFDLLDRWRHLPAYQLERRADVLFAIYLPAFLTDYLRIEIRAELVPEFPVRLGTIYSGLVAQKQNRSCKIDYLALSKDSSQAFFVELKTDALSRRERQDEYLRLAQQVGLPALIRGVTKLFLKTAAKNKYFHLLLLLDSIGLIQVPDGFHALAKRGWRGVGAGIHQIKIEQTSPAITVLYLQPEGSETGEIGFEDLANWLTRFDDPLSKKFCESLRRWKVNPVGTISNFMI